MGKSSLVGRASDCDSGGQRFKSVLLPFLLLKIKKSTMLLDFLFISFVLFLLGVLGIILNRKNIILILIAIELILLAVNLNFIVFSVFLDDLLGQVFSLLILTIAAAESAVGLAIVVIYYRVRGSILIENLAVMRG
tara:strand:- start:384 stop:791 length:408 start_codon:yes stop_codon:yes gene_type:complete